MHHVSTLLRQLTLTHSVPRLLQSSGGPKGRRSRRPPPSCTWSCSVGGRRQEVWPEGHLRPVLDVVGPALSLSPASAASLDVALKDGFGEGVVHHDVAKPRQLSSPDGCQERFFRTHQAPHAVVGFVLSVRDAEKFLQALGLECLDSSLVVRHQSPCLTFVEQDGHNQWLEQLEFGLEADVTDSK